MTLDPCRSEVLAAPWLDPAAFDNVETTPAARRNGWLRDRLARFQASAEVDSHWRAVWPDPAEALWQRWCDLARERVEVVGPTFRLRPDLDQPGREILAWRQLSLRVPSGVILAAACPAGVRPPERLSLLPQWLAPQSPVAHLHVHLKASPRFDDVWAHLMSGRRGDDIDKVPPGFATEQWRNLLVAAAALRVLLAQPGSVMAGSNPTPLIQTLWSDPLVQRDIALAIPVLLNLGSGPAANSYWRARVRGAVRDHARVNNANRANQSRVRLPDPIDNGQPWPEGAMLSRWFKALTADRGGLAKEWGGLFCQYLRVQCRLHQFLVHDPTEQGLTAFVETFDRLKPYRAGLNDGQLIKTACTEPDLPTLGACELRISPDTPFALGKKVKQLENDKLPVDKSYILHFGRDLDADRGLEKTHRHLRIASRNIQRAIARVPERLRWLRALDLAGNERAGPLWVAAGVLQETRRRSDEIAAQNAAQNSLPPMRMTLHVGEDYAHLASGLRAIHEPLLWKLLRPGDRLGHAVALAVDPKNWAAMHPRVPMPRHVRLLDLAWMLGMIAGTNRAGIRHRSGDTIPGDAEPRFREELRQHLRMLKLQDDLDVTHFHRTLIELPSLVAWSDPNTFCPDPLRAMFISWCRQRLPAHRMPVAPQHPLDEVIDVDTVVDVPVLQALSQQLRLQIAGMQLGIELNPSSNQIIAGNANPLDQPAFRLHPLQDSEGMALPVTINADDPLTFATCLADEFAYAWAGLVATGATSPAVARSWLEEAARASWRWRFTAAPPDTAARATEGNSTP